MNEKHKLFVYALLKDPSITQEQAAIEAGYAPKSARVTASQLLTKPNIQEALRIGRQAMAKRNEITLDDLVQEMKTLAFASIPEIIEWNDSGVGFRPSDKIKAIESLGKMLGLIVEKHDITVHEDRPARDIESEVLYRRLQGPDDE